MLTNKNRLKVRYHLYSFYEHKIIVYIRSMGTHMSYKRKKIYMGMTKTNFRIVVILVEKERKERRNELDFFSIKFCLGKNKAKENMAKIIICQIWAVIYICLL